MAIDAIKVVAIIEKRKGTHPEYTAALDDIRAMLLDTLGDVEDDIIEFVRNADKDTQDYVSEIAEGLYDKFATPRMDKFLGEMYPAYWVDMLGIRD